MLAAIELGLVPLMSVPLMLVLQTNGKTVVERLQGLQLLDRCPSSYRQLTPSAIPLNEIIYYHSIMKLNRGRSVTIRGQNRPESQVFELLYSHRYPETWLWKIFERLQHGGGIVKYQGKSICPIGGYQATPQKTPPLRSTTPQPQCLPRRRPATSPSLRKGKLLL